MSSAQLSKELPISIKQQSKLRKENNFPIPSQTIGRNIYYSIFHIADFLINGSVSEKTTATPGTSVPKSEKLGIVRTKNQKQQKQTQNLSHLFLLKFLTQRITEEAQRLTSLSENLARYADSATLKSKLENDMHEVDGKRFIEKV